MNRRATLPKAAIAALVSAGAVTAIGVLLSPSPAAVLAAGGALIAIVLMLWRQHFPPILLLPAVYQWSEVAVSALQTVLKGKPLSELSVYGVDLQHAATYGLLGVLAFSTGLAIVGQARLTAIDTALRSEAGGWTFAQVALVAFSAIAAGYLLAAASSLGGPTRQLFGVLAWVKYPGLFLFTYWSLVRQRHQDILVLLVSFETLIGMTGFFAGFKESLLTVIMASLAARPSLKLRDTAVLAGAFLLLLSVAVFWTHIKPEYRSFVNKGTGEQVVLVPLEERIEFVVKALDEFDAEAYADGFDGLLARHGYIDYLALTMENVPANVPFQEGGQTFKMLRHIAVPRVLYPDKPALPSDTEVMAYFTGLPNVWNDNTSISLGYLGELYADFGYWGGLAAAWAIGLVAGGAFRIILHGRTPSLLVRVALTTMIALPFAYFGQAYVKTMGAFVFALAVALTLDRLILPMALPRFLARRAAASERRLNPISRRRDVP